MQPGTLHGHRSEPWRLEAVVWCLTVLVTPFLIDNLLLCGNGLPDSLQLLFSSGPWQCSPGLTLGHLLVSTYAPFFLEVGSVPGPPTPPPQRLPRRRVSVYVCSLVAQLLSMFTLASVYG